ncbi:methyltransferase domain-containing protein [Pelistega sp. NLN82]|uniref:Methyltransferase domain-containing protein n=1 Tax=Pelistega ratti TaxID=2652177 RepID=A0A6L9Y3S6_9BURK|nr:methyltransferase domain-containing protein [Pelistega ratti]NEN74866.1 methyltransferase domain-containing protein [Pelistega ratti]
MSDHLSPDTSSLQERSINARHVALQFARRRSLAQARFILDEIAQRMIDRLSYIRMQPTTLIDMGCGPGLRLSALQEKYPKMNYIGVDSCPTFIQEANDTLKKKGVKSLLNHILSSKSVSFIQKDMAETGLAPESADIIWSNLALHWHPSPERVMAEWRRLLKVGGLCMFSCFGPHTCIEVREALGRAGLVTQTMDFVDMHDFGDMMIDQGFLDPVMDQEIITLTYKTPEKLLADVYHLGGNPCTGRSDGLKGRQWYQALLDGLEQGRKEDGLLHLTLELCYGHAWRSATTKGSQPGETRISISSIGYRS